MKGESESISTPLGEFIFSEVILTEMAPEAFGMFFVHYREAHEVTDGELDIDFKTYLRLEEQGRLKSFALFSEKGEIAGYACYDVVHNIKNKSHTRAQQDLLFIAPELRGKGVGAAFIQAIERRLMAHGADYIYQQTRVRTDFSKTLEGLGYSLVDYGYVKELREEAPWAES